MHTRHAQHGLTLVGFLFVVAVVIIFALVAFRTIPSYIEYYTVKKAVQGALDDSPDGTAISVKKAFERRIGADYVDSVSWQDLQVQKQGNDIVGTISWEKRLPLFYNISLLLDFEVTATK